MVMTQSTPVANQEMALFCPMPGKVIKIFAQEGDTVKQGQSLLIVESMKMLHELRVPKPGTVRGIHVNVGDVIVPDHRVVCIL